MGQRPVSFIYLLYARDGKNTGYLGKTKRRPSVRFREHLEELACHPKNYWIWSVGHKNIRMEILAEVPTLLENLYEKMYIRELKRTGFNLVNATEGGDGCVPTPETRARMSEGQRRRDPPTPETRAKISASNTGKKRSKEAREKLRMAGLGRKHTQETKDKISVYSKARIHTEETKAKISVSNMGKSVGRKRSAETCAKISAARKGHKASPETRAKISASGIGKHVGQKMLDEARAKMSVAKKGKKQTPEHIAKRAASVRKYYMDMKTIEVTP
jgi:hypothetical protein